MQRRLQRGRCRISTAQIRQPYVLLHHHGTAYSGSTCTSATTNLVQGAAAQVTVTYPASLKIYGKTISSSFNLKAQTSEYIQ